MNRPLRGLLAAALCLTVAACSGLAAGPTPDTDPTKAPRPDKSARARPTPTPAPTPTPRPAEIVGLSGLVGADGRLTVLILGSDSRHGLSGERTDAIIVATIDPVTGKVAMVSLPRDTMNVPIAPGRISGRINGLLAEFERAGGKPREALRRLTAALSYAFDTEIDHYVLVEFRDLERLVDSIGGVQVRLKETLIDPTMHLGDKGLRLKAGRRRLDGKEALAFSRTRHSDSDYERSRRQHQVLVAAAARVRDRGVGALPALAELVAGRLETDISLEAAPALLALANRADLERPKSVVLAPSAFAGPGPLDYTISLRVDAVRAMFDRVFRPVR